MHHDRVTVPSEFGKEGKVNVMNSVIANSMQDEQSSLWRLFAAIQETYNVKRVRYKGTIYPVYAKEGSISETKPEFEEQMSNYVTRWNGILNYRRRMECFLGKCLTRSHSLADFRELLPEALYDYLPAWFEDAEKEINSVMTMEPRRIAQFKSINKHNYDFVTQFLALKLLMKGYK